MGNTKIQQGHTIKRINYFEEFFNSSNEGFCVIEVEADKNGQITDLIIREANPAFVLHSGLKNVVGKALSEILPNFEQYWIDIYQEVYITGQPNYFENYVQDLDRWYSIYLTRIGEKESKLIAVTYTDISQRKNTEKALLESEMRLAQVFDILPVGVGFYDNNGNFYLVNREMQRYLPGNKMPSKDKERGWRWRAWDNDNNPVPLQDFPGARALRGETVQPGLEMMYTNDDGKEVWTSVAAVPVHDGEAQVGMLVTITDIDRLKNAEEALKKREAELAAVQEIGGVAGLDIIISDEITGIRSQEYRKLHGLDDSVTSETNEQWLKRLHPDDRKRADKSLAEALKGRGSKYEVEYRIIRPNDGKIRWIYVKADIHRDANGKAVRLLGAHIDVTARRAMEEAIVKSEAYLSAIFSEAAVGLSVIDTSGKFLRVNDTLCKMLGRTQDELLVMSVPDVTVEEYIEPSIKAIKHLLATKRPLTLDKQYRRQDGSAIWANSTLSLLQLSGSTAPVIVAVTADITERKKAEETLKIFNNRLEYVVEERTMLLKEQGELLQATLDSTHEMIQVLKAVRRNGEIVDFIWIINNKTAQDYCGDVIGESLLKNNPGVVEAGIFQSFKQVVETGIPQHYEKLYQHEQFDGWFYQSVVKMDDGVVTFTANITERKQAEEAISELNKALTAKNRELESLHSELTTFTDVAANDYKVTLETLYIHLEHIIKSDAGRLSDSGKSNVRRAQSAVQKLKLLTEDIVAFSKVRYLDRNFTSLNIKTVMNDVLKDMAVAIEEKDARITFSGVLPYVNGSHLYLSILFYHLLDNALKFTDGNTRPIISISGREVESGVITASWPEERYCEISITDNGIGFPPKEALNILPYFIVFTKRNITKVQVLAWQFVKR